MKLKTDRENGERTERGREYIKSTVRERTEKEQRKRYQREGTERMN